MSSEALRVFDCHRSVAAPLQSRFCFATSAVLFFVLAAAQAFAQETPQETAALDRVGP